MRELPTPTLNLSPVSRPRGLLHPRSPAQSQPLVARPLAKTPAAGGIEVSWARHLDEVREAQRLRHAVFAGEMGAILSNAVPGHDVDLFDDFCE
ncbi:MAG: ornithine-acyl-ACP acyltransferase, partial [Hydrogenophaga sp.]|nr:ornithine-acyl-ACP acyltransferase [Hydrogenophaga sp.]